MGARGQRAGQRLRVDVAEVGHRQPADVQRARERLQTDAGLDAHAALPRVQDAVERVERQQRAVGHDPRAERVARARDAHRPGSGGDDLRQLVPGPRMGDPRRRGALGARPIDPLHAADGTVSAMDVSPERVAELQREGSIQLIDIREDYEWEAGRIPGARFLTLGELTAQAETIDPETPVVFYCRVGG